MINAIYITLVWIICIVFAWGTIRRSKGDDWYSPITNKHKMVMCVINLIIIIIIPTFFLDFLLLKNTYFAIINSVFGTITITATVFYLICLKRKVPDSDNNSQDGLLRKLTERFLTVFNTSYFIITMLYAIVYSGIYMGLGNKRFESTSSLLYFLSPAAEVDNTFIISLSLIFWLALFTGVVTFYDLFKNQNDNDDLGKPQLVDYFWKRVKKRGRKS